MGSHTAAHVLSQALLHGVPFKFQLHPALLLFVRLAAAPKVPGLGRDHELPSATGSHPELLADLAVGVAPISPC